jgi:hypothetical protein
MQTMRVSRRALLLGTFTAALRAADEFWSTKPAAEWTVEESEKLLADSPWAKTMTVARGALLEGVSGGPVRGPRGVTVARTVDLTIRWMSAAPMKLAMAKLVGPRASKKQGGAMGDIDGYVLIVKGVPLSVMQLSGETRASLERSAEIRIPGRDSLKVSRLGFARDGAAAEIRFLFPKEPNLTISDKSAEFRFELGRANIKQKFDLDEMVYQGELAL